MSEPVAPAPAAPQYAPPQVTKSGGTGRRLVVRLVGVVVALVVIYGGYAIYDHIKGDPSVAKVGDCLNDAAAKHTKVVKCTSADAKWKVLGKVDQDTEPSDSQAQTLCDQWPATKEGFWETQNGDGFFLCLATNG